MSFKLKKTNAEEFMSKYTQSLYTQTNYDRKFRIHGDIVPVISKETNKSNEILSLNIEVRPEELQIIKIGVRISLDGFPGYCAIECNSFTKIFTFRSNVSNIHLNKWLAEYISNDLKERHKDIEIWLEGVLSYSPAILFDDQDFINKRLQNHKRRIKALTPLMHLEDV